MEDQFRPLVMVGWTKHLVGGEGGGKVNFGLNSTKLLQIVTFSLCFIKLKFSDINVYRQNFRSESSLKIFLWTCMDILGIPITKWLKIQYVNLTMDKF